MDFALFNFFHYRKSDNSIQVEAGLCTSFTSVKAEALAVCLSLPIDNMLPQANCTASKKCGSSGNQCAAIKELGVGTASL